MKTDLRELRISGGTTVVPSKTNTHHGGSSSKTAVLDAFEGASGRSPRQQPDSAASALAPPQSSSRSAGAILNEIPAVPENRRALHAEPTSIPKTPGVHLRTLYAEDQETKIAELFRVRLEPGERSIPFEGEMLAFVLRGGGEVRHGEAFENDHPIGPEHSFYLPRDQKGQLMADEDVPLDVLVVRICKQLSLWPGKEAVFTHESAPDPKNEYPAPDTSKIFQAVDSPIGTGGLAIAVLEGKQVSIPVQHRTIYEMWFVLEGDGDFVQPAHPGAGDGVRLEPDTTLTVMPHEPFQFRNTGTRKLRILMLTAASWPGGKEATVKPGAECACWPHGGLPHPEAAAPAEPRAADDQVPNDTLVLRSA